MFLSDVYFYKCGLLGEWAGVGQFSVPEFLAAFESLKFFLFTESSP